MRNPRSCGFWLAMLALAGCRAEPTNTGYVGTWSRGSGPVRSMLAIVADGDAYRVRWTLESDDDTRRVRCDWEGECEEFIEQDRISKFTLTPSIDPDSGNLRIECNGTAYVPEETAMHYLDELTLRSRGKKMIAHTLEEAGQVWTREDREPRRIFQKISDDVADPPPARPRADS